MSGSATIEELLRPVLTDYAYCARTVSLDFQALESCLPAKS